MNRKRVFIVSLLLMLVLSLQAFAETPVYKEGSRGAGPGSTGWVSMKDGSWKYLDGKGYAKDCWQEIDGSWYWFGTDGMMQTGWQEIGGRWYWFGTDGKMMTGWQNINGEEFYFTETADENHPQGSCYLNENTPDGFVTNERGVKIIGDMPMYVSADSSDVWADPEIFMLDEKGNPVKNYQIKTNN